MAPDVDLSVIVPAFNEGVRIEHTLARIATFVDARSATWEIIVVDDGSTDDTAERVRRASERWPEGAMRLARLDRNRGKGAALRRGVAESVGRRVLVTDADLSTPIEELVTLGRALDAGADVACASRAVKPARIVRSQPAIRVMLGRAGNLLIRALAVPGVHDTQCGFKLFDGNVARILYSHARERRFAIDVEVLSLAMRFGFGVVEVGVAWSHEPGANVRWWDYLDVLAAVIRIPWRAARVGGSRAAVLVPSAATPHGDPAAKSDRQCDTERAPRE
jgi:dolichyl-phosphate beta-glucosyltransferase